MAIVTKTDAFIQLVEAIDKNDITSANEILKIINKSIKNNKQENINSSFFCLNSKKDEKYFENCIVSHNYDS